MIQITFFEYDILLPQFLRRYLDKAKRIKGYEEQVKYVEKILSQLNEKNIVYKFPIEKEEGE